MRRNIVRGGFLLRLPLLARHYLGSAWRQDWTLEQSESYSMLTCALAYDVQAFVSLLVSFHFSIMLLPSMICRNTQERDGPEAQTDWGCGPISAKFGRASS